MIVKHDSVISSAHYICLNSEHVSIDVESLSRAADKISSDIVSKTVPWKSHPLNPKVPDKRAANWIFVCDLLNFSFWVDGASYQVTYNGITYAGYWAFCAALNRAEDEGHPLHDFQQSVKLSFEDFSILFRSDDCAELPLLRERYQIFISAAIKLIRKYNGCFTNLSAEAGNNALRLVNILNVEFPSFFDVAWYKGEQVFFLKRAQILVADLWACFENQGYGKFETVDFITIFADYRIPQLFSHMGVLVYSNELANKIKTGELIPSGSQLECEIRGLSIYAANLIKERIAEKHPELEVNAILLDFFLWDYVKKHAVDLGKTPFHRTRTVYY